MARRVKCRQAKKAIYVFWEGESEEVYSKVLKKMFDAQVALKTHREKGTFDTAKAYCKNISFKNYLPEYDEVWFFFDTEIEKANQWKNVTDCVNAITGINKNIKVRLLMTSGCVEYWFLLHYEKKRPQIAIPPDKERILKNLQKYVPSYKKGDPISASEIAQNYSKAVENGRWTLECLAREGMPSGSGKDRDEWLFRGQHTFTTVHEALEALMALQ